MRDAFLGIARDKFDAILMVVFCALVLLNGVTLAYAVYENIQRAEEVAVVAEAVLSAHCYQRVYAQKQVEQTSDLLAASTKTVFWNRVTREQLIAQLQAERAFRDTLKGLDCRAYKGAGPS